MERCLLIAVGTFVGLAYCHQVARADDFYTGSHPALSGMAVLRQDEHHTTYLVVSDAKDDPVEGCHRFGTIEIDAVPAENACHSRILYRDIDRVDWARHPAAMDAEAVCAMPGTANDYLVCQSRGRLYRIAAANFLDGWRLEVKQALTLPKFADDIEGIACQAASSGRILLLIGERGTGVRGGDLHWGWLDELEQQVPADDGTVQWPSQTLTLRSPLADVRDISDLYLDQRGLLWVSAALDPGNSGPFMSTISLAAIVNADEPEAVFQLGPFRPLWELHGFKIEALGAAATRGATLSFCTDDENFDGAWGQV